MITPDGWHSTELGKLLAKKLAMLQTGPFGTVLNASEFVKHGIPIISVREIRNGYIQVYDETPRLSSFTAKRIPKYLLKHSDLVFARKGSVGRCALIQGKEDGYFLGSDAIYLRFLSKDISPQFILHYLHSYEVNNYLVQNAYGTTMAGLNEKILSALPLQYPSAPKEQEAIAEALSDADSMIASLQKLIAKKKAIKQGVMQALLTGKRRLPGFSGKWKQLNLAKESKIKARIGWQGLTTAEYLSHGFAYLITGTDFESGSINWQSCCYVDEKRFRQDSNIHIKNNDILLTKDGTIGKTAYVRELAMPATLNSGVFIVRPLKTDVYNSAFAYYILSSFVFEEFLAKLSAGSTITHLYQKDFSKFSFHAPIDINEQIAIAEILSEIDTEIEHLKKKLSKYQQIKQGMMQELLTGRIRLIAAEPRQE